MLAPVIEALKQITRYTEAELMAAVVQSFYTVFIKTESDSSQNPYGDMIPQAAQVENDDISYELGSGAVNVLKPGESVDLADPKRPNSGFEMFIASMAKMIGAALDIPCEVLMKSFQSSYSASRAALLEAWKSIKIDREFFINDFCKPIYEIWLSEAVALGRVNLPGFFNDPIVKAAWCRAEWIGPTQGQIEPVKEVTAAIMRIENCLSTREQETTALTGGDFDMNVAQAKLEQRKMIDAGLKEDPAKVNEGGGKGE
jgi:lambda family phage portal protein